jgi:hypothetical protein
MFVAVAVVALSMAWLTSARERIRRRHAFLGRQRALRKIWPDRNVAKPFAKPSLRLNSRRGWRRTIQFCKSRKALLGYRSQRVPLRGTSHARTVERSVDL